MGKGQIREFSGTLAQRLSKDNLKKSTAKSCRRSATTKFVEACMPIVGSCEASSWRSTEGAREHADHSTVSTDDHGPLLDDKK